MARKTRVYTEIGKRIAALGKRQTEIAGVLGVSQQNVSKKLRGTCAILLSDLETLAKAYEVPLTYFFEEPGNAELAQALERIRTSAKPLRDLMIHASQLRDVDLKKLLAIAKAVGK